MKTEAAEEEKNIKVVELYPHNYRDPIQTLRQIADDLERGDYGAVQTCVVITHCFDDDCGQVVVHGTGKESDDTRCYILIRQAEEDLRAVIMSQPSKR